MSKTYAHLQTMTKTSVEVQNNWHKTEGGVAHTRYIVFIHFDRKNDKRSSSEKACIFPS